MATTKLKTASIPEKSPVRVLGRCIFFFLIVNIALSSCASAKRPVLYPNTHYKTVGRSAANHDVAECSRLASDFGLPENQSGEIPKKAGTEAAIGAASAGAWGLVRGDPGERALAGAAAGGAAGAMRGAFRSGELDPTYKRFVEKCLDDRGYDVIGWR